MFVYIEWDIGRNQCPEATVPLDESFHRSDERRWVFLSDSICIYACVFVYVLLINNGPLSTSYRDLCEGPCHRQGTFPAPQRRQGQGDTQKRDH